MNLSQYVKQGWSVGKGVFFFWSSGYYRPLGGLAYLLLYDVFGFTRLPFRLAAFALLLYNITLTARIAYLILRSWPLALLAVLFTCYHAAQNQLYYDFGTIYELLCFAFLYSAFVIYLRHRQQDRVLSARTIAAIALLQIGALNSKEMGVLLPALFLLYEACFVWPEKRGWPSWRSLLPIAVTGSLSLLFIIGKAAGTESLFNHPNYRPVFSFSIYASNMAHYLGLLFYRDAISPPVAIAILVVGLVLSVMMRSRAMLFGWLWFLTALLPVSFIFGRAGFVLYIPAVGMAIALIAFWQAAAKPYLSTLGAPQYSLFNPRSAAAFAIAFLVFLAIDRAEKIRYDPEVMPAITACRQVAKAMARITPHPVKGAKILFVNDPFPRESYNAYFLPYLQRRDSTIRVARARFNLLALSSAIAPRFDEIYDYRRERLIQVSTGDLPLYLRNAANERGQLDAIDGVFLDIDELLWTKQDYRLRARCPLDATACVVAISTMLPSPGYPLGETHTIAITLDGVFHHSVAAHPGVEATDVKTTIGGGEDHTLAYHLDHIMPASVHPLDDRELGMLINHATILAAE